MVPLQKRSPRTVHRWMIGPPGPNFTAIPGPTPDADGPTLSKVFRVSVEAQKCARKDEAAQLAEGGFFQGELNNGI